MTPKTKPLFDPKIFLAKVGQGRTIAEYSKDQMVFSQSDPANAVFYIQKGKVKLMVVSNAGKEAVIAILDSGDFLGEGWPEGPATTHGNRLRNFRLRDRTTGESGHDPCAPR